MNVSSSLPDSPAVYRPRLDVVRTLAPVTRAIGLRYLTRSALLGLGGGAVLGAGILIAAHVRAFGLALPLAITLAVLGLVAGAALGTARWPRPTDAARAADLHFGLDDRLTTALELHGSNTPVALLQSRELEQRIGGLALSRWRGGWLRRSEAGGVALAVLLFAGALVLGPSHAVGHTVTTASTTSAKNRQAAAKQVQKMASQLQLGLTPAQLQSPAMRKLNASLAQLRRQLLRASSPRASLRAVSLTQQQLRQLAQQLHPVNSRAVAQLNSSLSHYLKGNYRSSNGKSSTARSDLATARALNSLASSLRHLTPAQSAALARALARAANSTQDNTLRQAMRQAASALANGQRQAAQAALQQAAHMLAQSSNAQLTQARAGMAQAQLNALKGQLARQMAGTGQSLAAGPSSKGQGKQGAGAGRPGTGSGRLPPSAAGAGRGQGTRSGLGRGAGQGQRSGQGRGAGQGQLPGQGRGPGIGYGRTLGHGNGQAAGRSGNGGNSGFAGGHGAGGRGTSARTRSGKTVTVYVPGQQGKGPTINRTGPNGAAQPGAIVPYQQVVGQYTQSAHQALDRAALPPSLQAYVRRYFTTLSH